MFGSGLISFSYEKYLVVNDLETSYSLEKLDLFINYREIWTKQPYS